MTTPLTSRQVFFAFPRISDPARHHDYNAWHQLDHRPENLALPGVVHGDRWVRSPDCAAAGQAPSPLLSSFHYLAMYWFAEPASRSIEEWKALGESTRRAGRRPDLAYTTRPLLGFFRPLRGVVHPRAGISAAALPFRPHRGVHVTVTDPQGADPPDLAQVLELDGVLGGWTFDSEAVSAEGLDGTRRPLSASLRVTLYYLDRDPVAFAPPPTTGELLLSSPLRTIEPWRWTWFEEAR
ncbi:hypothetical protein [Lentzea albidocapillata]|uniref:Uncharacterized protein n=1 Tax=Lentzea albidocapillata TaxID=40571 RepID=A0A1W2DF69_9PSEU|nr:hypothetical protein [Lentzea albidocapillata]SMC96199.1 hypothetical protein SAMN05660733_02968 [Lentzea albidocapillata]